MIPRKSATVHSEILNDEVCVYEWTTKEVHVLNSTAARIWRLCDGRTSVREIARPLAAELGIRDAEAVVWLALRDFREKGLIESGLAMPDDRALSRRQLIARLGVAAAALPVIRSIVAPTALQAASAGTQTFNFTGAVQGFVVPAGVTSILVDVSGGQGGAGAGASTGGKRGRVLAMLAVTPGELLTVNVGGAGSYGDLGGAGGFNGGGNGGAYAGGGGGASDLRRGTTKLVVAGGGGGAATASGSVGGGAGGGLIGAVGISPSVANSGFGGGGGTQSAGGTGGAGVQYSGADGTSGLGGAGGLGSAPLISGGGGGGGGYFGGGGGGTGFAPLGGLPAGGGGGSSFTDPAATNVSHTQGARSGDGQIIISW